MKKLFILLSLVASFFLLQSVIHIPIAHAVDCNNGRVILSQDPIPHNFKGPLFVSVDNKCFVLKAGYVVVAFPNGGSTNCRSGFGPLNICSQATISNCSGSNGACNGLSANVDFSSIGNRDTNTNQINGWTLEICPNTNNNTNNPDCTSPAATTTFTYGSADTNPFPKIQLGPNTKCYFQVGSSLPFTVTNLVPGQNYGWFWLDEWTTFHNGHPTIDTVTANNATMTIDFSKSGSADQKGGNPPLKRTICIDGFGTQRQSPDNCIDLFFSTGPVKGSGLCAGDPPPPQQRTECEINHNGFCDTLQGHCQDVPSGGLNTTYNPITGNDHAGVANFGCGTTDQCCAPACANPPSGSCGTSIGSGWCCDLTKTSCFIAPGETVGVCQGCSGKGQSCGTAQSCCTGNNLTCSNPNATANGGTCIECIQDGDTTKKCDSTHPCCSGNNNCTNGGQCVSACTEGMACKGDQDCCSGFTCQNGGCSKNTNIGVPTFPPVNWCDSTMKSCNTALGDWSFVPANFIRTLFAIVLSLAGAIAVLTIIYAGYIYMSSQGNPEHIKNAQELLTAAVVGLLFTIFSLVILQTIGVDLLHIPGFNP